MAGVESIGKDILLLFIAGGIGGVGWTIKNLQKKFADLNGSITSIIEKHHECREELPLRFATTETVKEIINKLEPIRLDVALIKKEIRIKMRALRT